MAPHKERIKPFIRRRVTMTDKVGQYRAHNHFTGETFVGPYLALLDHVGEWMLAGNIVSFHEVVD